MDRNELVVTQCGGYALEQVESVAAGLDPEAARAAERLRTGRWAYRAVKRAFDVCFSACVLVCLSWLFLIVAIAIKLDDPEGPVIFSQARVTRVGRFLRKTSMAPVIIGTPGDGEPTKSLSHPVNSSLDLHKCERRPEPFLVAQTHYTSFQFLSFAVSGGLNAARGRPLCACGAAPFKDFRAVA